MRITESQLRQIIREEMMIVEAGAAKNPAAIAAIKAYYTESGKLAGPSTAEKSVKMLSLQKKLATDLKLQGLIDAADISMQFQYAGYMGDAIPAFANELVKMQKTPA